jgi:hypothetical protein
MKPKAVVFVLEAWNTDACSSRPLSGENFNDGFGLEVAAAKMLAAPGWF